MNALISEIATAINEFEEKENRTPTTITFQRKKSRQLLLLLDDVFGGLDQKFIDLLEATLTEGPSAFQDAEICGMKIKLGGPGSEFVLS